MVNGTGHYGQKMLEIWERYDARSVFGVARARPRRRQFE
jgi:hypothetical protein